MGKINVNVCYKIAFDALANNLNLDQIVERIRDDIHASIMVVEYSGKIVAYARGGVRRKTTGIKKNWITTAMYDHVMRGRILDTDYYELPGCMAVIKRIENKGCHLGYCVIVFNDEYTKDDYSEIADILRSVVASYWMNCEVYPDENVSFRKRLVNHDIFYGTKSELCYLAREIRGNYIMACFSGKQNKNYFPMIQEIWERSYGRMDDKEFWVLFYDIRDKKDEEVLLNKLGEVKEACCVSSRFLEIEQCEKKVKWLHRMNEIKEYNKVEEIMFEGEWYAHIIYSYAWPILKNKGLRDYSVEILKKEDEEKNTDLYETLKMYYLCGNNIAETASRMYVHRNTLVYRLRKIRELIGSDIDDMEQSGELLAFMMMDDLERMEERLNETGSGFARNI